MNWKQNVWSDEEIAQIYELRRTEPPTTWREIGRRLGRSEDATRQQYERQKRKALNLPKPDRYIPAPLTGNDDLHLELIAQANSGKGFPFLNLPPAYRVAA